MIMVGVLGLIFRSGSQAQAATGINEQVNYQGRLLTSTGAVVPDGTYNMEFKIIQDGDGCPDPPTDTPPCGGTVEWTETRTGGNKVTVKNGYFSVYLGAVTPFSGSVDWNQDTLWLSVNIGGTGTPSWDGEMEPFNRLSSSPYALNSKALGGLTASDFVKLAQGSQTDASLVSSIFINKTGASGNILELEKNGADVFLLNNTGAVTFQNTVDSTTGFQILDADGGTPIFNIDTTNERVGIGTATPGYALELATASNIVSRFTSSSTSDTEFQIRNSSTGGRIWTLVSAGQTPTGGDIANLATGSFSIYDGTSGLNRLVITSSGSIGIGDTTPDYLLDVAGTLGVDGAVTIGDAIGDAVTVNSGAWTFTNDTTIALSGGVNGLNFDSDTLSIDATNNRVGIGTAGPTNTLSVNGTADIQGHAAIGAGAAVNGALTVVDSLIGVSSHSTILSVYETTTTTGSASVGYDGLLVNNILNPSGTATYGQVNGLNGFLTVASGNAQNMSSGGGVNGFNGGVIHAGTGTISGNTSGVNGAVVNSGGGTLDITNGVNATIVQTSGTINAARGINIATPINYGTITNNYGLYINDQSGVGASDSYNIYSAGASSQNYFAGSIIAGSANTVLTLSTGKIDGDALTLIAAADGGTGTSSGSGLAIRSDGVGLLQGCNDGQVLAWVESTDTWDCSTPSGGGANTALSNIASTNLSAALNVTSGNLNLTTTTSGNIVLNSAGTIELQDNTTITGTLSVQGTTASIGVNDTTGGFLDIFGNGTGTAEGGEARLYLAADYDTTFNSIVFDAYEDDLRIHNGSSVLFVLQGDSGNVDFSGTLTAGSADTVLTLSTGKIDGDALTLIAAADGGAGTSSGSGLTIRSDGVGLLQGCNDGQVLAWVESTDTWDCATVSGGSGANTALSNLASVAINTSLLPGADNTIDLGSSSFSFRTAYADTSVLTPLVDTSGALSLGTGSSTATNLGKSGTTLTINPTAWTATPTISGLVTATSGLTAGSGSNTATILVNKTATATVGSPYQDSNKITFRGSGYCCGGDYDADFNIRNKMAAEDFVPRGYLAFNSGSAADLFTLSHSGAVVFQPTEDRTNGFQIRDTDGGNPIFNVDYTNERVGIGTATPSEKVQIVVGSSTTALAWGNGTIQGELYSGGTSSAIGTSTNHDFQFYTNDTYRLTLEAGGDFGVGTTAPGTKLHVADVPNNSSGGIYVDDVSGKRVVISPSNGATGIPYVGTLTNNDLSLGTNNNESIRLLTNGNVGIGGTAPDGKLEVEDTAGSLMTVSQASADSFDRARVQIGNAGNGLDQLYVNGRFNTAYQMFFQDFLGNIATVAADGNWANSSYDEIVGTGGTTPSGSIKIQNTTGVSGAARLTFTGTLGTGPWGSNWGTAGILFTERSLNPVMEARVVASSNTDQRAVVGFTDVAANTAVSADTNLSANEAFFRKTAAGTQWEAVSRAGSGTEQVTTSVGSTSSYQLLRVELDNTNTAVRFYVNNSLVATHSTAVPGSTTRLGWNVMNTPTTTTYSGRVVDIDYVRVWSDDPPKSQGDSGLTYELVEDTEPTAQDIESIELEIADTEVPNAEDIIADLDEQAPVVDPVEGTSSESGVLGDSDTQSNDLGSVTMDSATITLDLNVTGILFANGGLKVAGPSEFMGDAIFNSLVSFIGPSEFTGDANFAGRATFNKDSGGFAVIQTGKQEVKIVFDRPYTDTPVVTLTNKKGQFVDYAYKDLTKEGFTIILKEPATADVEMSWTALSVKQAKVTVSP